MIRDMIDKQVLELKKLWANKRQLLFQLLNLAMIVFSALMIWKGLMFLTKVRETRSLLDLVFLQPGRLVCLCQSVFHTNNPIASISLLLLVRIPSGRRLVGFHGTRLSTW
jgi:hypothetical protein